MSSQAKTVQHFGKVQEISLNSIKVAIQGQVSCAGCQAHTVCGSADFGSKFVLVQRQNHSFIVGDDVRVTMLQSIGFWALFMGYILPFIVVLVALIIFTVMGFNEGLSGLISLGLLVPYFVFLYLFRDKISKRINFDIQKI